MAWENDDYFASKTEVEALIGLNTGTSAVDMTEAELNYVLPHLQNMVHDYLTLKRIYSSTALPLASTVAGYATIKNCVLALLCMYIQRREFMKKTGRIENATFYMTYAPALTKLLREDLDLINQFIASGQI